MLGFSQSRGQGLAPEKSSKIVFQQLRRPVSPFWVVWMRHLDFGSERHFVVLFVFFFLLRWVRVAWLFSLPRLERILVFVVSPRELTSGRYTVRESVLPQAVVFLFLPL